MYMAFATIVMLSAVTERATAQSAPEAVISAKNARAVKVVNGVGTVFAVGETLYTINELRSLHSQGKISTEDFARLTGEKVVGVGSGLAVGWAGAEIGAYTGAVVGGPVGAVVGVVVGGGVGYLVGEFGGTRFGGWLTAKVLK
jgi:hypothetical protein